MDTAGSGRAVNHNKGRKAYTYGKGSMATVRNANNDVAHCE
jgi:hypothetical protein